jgi:hypothetical protein
MLREEHGLAVFENRMLRKIFDLRRRKWRETGENCIMRGFANYTLHQILGRSSHGQLDGRGV